VICFGKGETEPEALLATTIDPNRLAGDDGYLLLRGFA